MILSRHTVLLIMVVAFMGIYIAPTCAAQSVATVDPATIRVGPIRHSKLPQALIERVKAFEPVFANVYPITHKEWLEGFQRDKHPESEIAIWEQIAVAFRQFTSNRNVTVAMQSEAFNLLLFRSGATAEETLMQANLKYLTKAEAQKILSFYNAPPKPISVEKQ